MALDGTEAPDENTSLSEGDLAIGAVEIAWRVLPIRRCLVVPPHLCALVAAYISTGDVAWEGTELCEQLNSYAVRAEVRLTFESGFLGAPGGYHARPKR